MLTPQEVEQFRAKYNITTPTATVTSGESPRMQRLKGVVNKSDQRAKMIEQQKNAPKQDGFFSNINEPAYKMSENNDGLGGTLKKEGANILKSGLKFGKGTLDFLNPKNTIDKLKEIPGTVKGYASDLKGAGEAEKIAQELEAKAKQKLGKNPVAPQTDFNDLMPDTRKALYETVTPEAAQLAVKGEGTKALESLAEDPFQVAPALLMAKGAVGKGGALEGTKVGKALDTAVSKTAQVVTKPVAKVASTVSNYGKGLAKFGTSQATGMSPKTLETIIKNPDEFSKAKIAEHSREAIGQEAFGNIQSRIEDLSETGKAYKPIREAKSPVTIPKGTVEGVLGNHGIEVGENGKLNFTKESIPTSPADQGAIQNWYDTYGKDTEHTSNSLLNARKASNQLAQFGSKSTDEVNILGRELYSKLNETGRPQIQGLEDLDTKYSSEVGELKKVKTDYFNSDGTLKDNALSKIANLTKEGRQPVLERLEKVSPGITKKITVLNAVEDIANSSGQKVGTYGRAALATGGLLTANIPAIVAAILSEPRIATQILRGFGKLSQATPKAITSALGSIKNVLNTDTKDIPIGLSTKDVSPYMKNGKVYIPGQKAVPVNTFKPEPGVFPKSLRQGETLTKNDNFQPKPLK